MRSILSKSLLIGLCLAAAGCVAHVAFETEPDWYARSSGPYMMSHERVFYGIGSAAGTGPSTLMRATADNRARAEMARILRRYLAALSRISPTMGARANEEREQLEGRLLQQALDRAVISDHWSQGPSNRLFALCEISLASFKQVLQEDASLDKALRTDLLTRAETAHAQLSQNFQTDNQ